MAIKPPGSTGPGAPAAPTSDAVSSSSKARSTGAGFSDAIDKASSPREASPVQGAVGEVAADIHAGTTVRGPEAVRAIIEKLVDRQLGPGATPRQRRERVEELDFVLGEDPEFTRRVQRMLDGALEELRSDDA